MPKFAFAHSPLNRLAHLRAQHDEIEKRRDLSTSLCFWVCGDQLKLSGDDVDLSCPRQGATAYFLGEDTDGTNWFATAAKPDDSLKSLRSIMLEGQLSKERLSIAAQARSLVHWHESHGFCARCGRASEIEDAGYRRHCTACGADHFPRTDPVVIMAVISGKRALLGRQKTWPVGMYSTLAGFVEPGETLEAAVAREVFEEVGVKLGPIEYVTSQPWPFPTNVMIGMIAHATSDHLVIDESEIETARWFDADELRSMLNNTHPQGLTASRPDAIAFHLAEEALKRIS